MREIECICLEKNNSLLQNYFKKMAQDIGAKIIFFDWMNPGVSDHSPLIAIVNFDHLDALKKLAHNRNEKMIIAFNSRKDFKIVPELMDLFGKVFGFIDLSQEIEYNIPILTNYLNLNFSKNKISLEKLANDLSKVYEFTQNELTKVKDLHDRIVKARVDQLKGAKVTSKFMAGEKSGGEFFEIVQNDHEIIFLQAGSDSYLLSSLILSEFERLKENQSSSQLRKNADQSIKNMIRHSKDQPGEFSYCLMSLDLKTLEASFSFQGEGHFFYQNKLIQFDSSMILKLRPKERLILLSEGAIKNMEFLTQLSCEKFFIDHQDKNVNDLINEYFFEISRKKSGKFFIYDAFLAVIEIDENWMYRLT